ncbi:bile acid:sodium symporter family protein (plasmid) [Streptomyces sp. WAC00288]|uniref:bile acid:sodium symporter family protein n=1 Tax=unclassified Streptomyces TaxID=2593676 RepID=UPI0007884A11|nr:MULTISPECIES: bile acid:sodium symporter family protein [unclassified Streptomyces]AVI00218.1 bile acid:sodium symporter family protein [Streptomyces sp. WAC00288]KYG51064.1 bile acid:sodium symporter [Streptomyces sp. WAC04657]
MDTPLATVFLPLALAVIMFGLGLSLTIEDFRRVRRHPRAVVVAMLCQLLLLPVVCLGLVIAFGLSPALAVGMMLLAASPGGTTANLFSHLFGGDVALNVTLTAVNAVLAIVTLPIITNFALQYFEPDIGQDTMGLQFGKVLQVFALVLVPVAIGLAVRRRSEAFARRTDSPVRQLSIVVLIAVIIGALVAERNNIVGYLLDVGPVALAFCVSSLTIGYFVPRLVRLDKRQSIACSMESGVHNSAVAMTLAISVLGSVSLAVPAAVYGVLMYPVAALAGVLMTRGSRAAEERLQAI